MSKIRSKNTGTRVANMPILRKPVRNEVYEVDFITGSGKFLHIFFKNFLVFQK